MQRQTTVAWSEPAIVSHFGRDIFGSFKVEASIVMQRHEVRQVPYRLSSDPKLPLNS